MPLLDALRWILANRSDFLVALGQHLLMCGIAMIAALAIGIPVAIAIRTRETLAAIALSLVNGLRTVPGLVILATMMPLLGIGLWPVVVALVILALPPIVANAHAGFRSIDPDILDAATGIGMSAWQSLWRVQLPLAGRAIFAGARTALIQVLAGATLAPFIGAGGLGDFITTGIGLMDIPRMLVGAIPIMLLALGSEFTLGRIELALFGPEAAS